MTPPQLLPSSPDCSVVLAGGPSASSLRQSLSSPGCERKNSGVTENHIPGKRAERVIIPTKHPPPAAYTQFVGRWAPLKFRSSTFPGLLQALRISWISTLQPACMRVSVPRPLLTPVSASPLQYRQDRI